MLLGVLPARAELVVPDACGPVDRRHDHVEVVGTTLRKLGKTPVARFGMVAFRNGQGEPIPFEIDERRGRKVMVTGPDVEETDHRPGQFDYDDAVIFMPCDAGERPPAPARDAYLERIHATTWREVEIEDTLTGRHAYAYVVIADAPPTTTRRYIEYADGDVVRTASYRIAMDQALPARFFLPGMGEFVGWQLTRLVFGQPLEDFQQFGHLDAGRHGQVFRAVKAPPIVVFANLVQALGKCV